MRKILISVVAALSSLAAMGQKADVVGIVDLGQIKFCTPTTATFNVTNSSSADMAIDHVETGCGCAKAFFTPASVAPGQDLEVQVVYNARTMGHFDRIIDVYTKGSEVPMMLELRGHVVENIAEATKIFEVLENPSKKADPSQPLPEKVGELYADCNSISFDDVPMGESFQQKFHIYNPTSEVVEPQLLHLPKYITAKISPSRIEPKHVAEVTVTFNSKESITTDDIGLLQNYVFLAKNPGDKVGKDKQMTISAVITPAITGDREYDADAPRISLSSYDILARISKGKKKTETIEIVNMGKQTLEIQRVQVFTHGITVTLDATSIAPGESTKMKVEVNSKEVAKAQASPRILLVTNDPDRQTVFVNIKDEDRNR